ncbi:hypothetical protein MTE01_29190 [Microbacterium testaceum]|uniref:Uncharacterized protein n=1 Tax=Microbacterium testaceum TaxID=2033 RepID=A0A4Y3QNU8_MICTE|nr:hypothetical protein [Microbacterium testaceum]GEB46974.1 hypothetical protein MTE01_29190 [Microbacterium testaceum]
MPNFTPTHRVKSDHPTYNNGDTSSWFALGDLVVLTEPHPDRDGDVRAKKAGAQDHWIALSCLEPLTGESTGSAATIKRDALIDAARDAGVEYSLATVIADAAENRSR